MSATGLVKAPPLVSSDIRFSDRQQRDRNRPAEADQIDPVEPPDSQGERKHFRKRWRGSTKIDIK